MTYFAKCSLQTGFRTPTPPATPNMEDIMNRLSPAQWAGIAIAAICAGIGAYFFFNPRIFSKVAVIAYHNWFFWVLISGGVVYAFYRRHRNPKEFTWLEVPVQCIVSAVVLLLICNLFFYFGSDLHDIEVWNGKARKAVYEERYDIKTCHQECDSEGKNCKTECHCNTWPPSWRLVTNNAESAGLSSSQYGNLKNWFGNERYAGSKGDRCAGNPGRIYETVYNGDPALLVPTAIEHPFVNYLKASKSIRKTTGGNTEGFEEFLTGYPRVRGGMFGKIYLDRVIIKGIPIPADKKSDIERWASGVDALLDKALAELGHTKEVNILVYVVGTGDRKFFQALDEHWKHAKKNDVVVIVGTTEFPKIDWADVIAWSRNTDFATTLKNRLEQLGSMDDGMAFARTILSQVELPLDQGGFERMSMKELAYLADDVEIAWWAMIVIVLIYGFLTWLTSWALENNELREFGARINRNTFGRMSDWRRNR